MATDGVERSVGEWAAEGQSRVDVLRKWGIDYCCGGRTSLEAACATRGLDAARVLAELERASSVPLDRTSDDDTERDWRRASLTELADHVVEVHHAYLRETLPDIGARIQKLCDVHGKSAPAFGELRSVFRELVNELVPHMMKEEQVLFPIIRQLESDGSAGAFPRAALPNVVHVMEDEHATAGRLLERLRELTAGYRVPPEACHTQRAMLESLAELESDLQRHIHEENNILFPGAERLVTWLLRVESGDRMPASAVS